MTQNKAVEGELTEERWIYLNQVACEARQGHEPEMTLGTEEVIQLTKAALTSLRKPQDTGRGEALEKLEAWEKWATDEGTPHDDCLMPEPLDYNELELGVFEAIKILKAIHAIRSKKVNP